MRPIETLLVLANLLTFSALTIPSLRAFRLTGYTALIALLIAGAQALLEGPRWQIIPTYALAGLFFLVWWLQTIPHTGLPQIRGWVKWLTASLAIGLGLLGLAVSIALPVLIPIFHFPQPTGPYPIGTLSYHWVDADRREVFSTDPNAQRELLVQIWYPAKENLSARRAPYVQDAAVLSAALAWRSRCLARSRYKKGRLSESRMGKKHEMFQFLHPLFGIAPISFGCHTDF